MVRVSMPHAAPVHRIDQHLEIFKKCLANADFVAILKGGFRRFCSLPGSQDLAAQ